MNRSAKFLIIFLLVSLLMGYPIYWEIVEGELSRSIIMMGMWAIASFLVYAVYVGWIKTGATVVMQERYSTNVNKTPLTRDEEILHQYVLFLGNIDSVVRDEDIEQ